MNSNENKSKSEILKDLLDRSSKLTPKIASDIFYVTQATLTLLDELNEFVEVNIDEYGTKNDIYTKINSIKTLVELQSNFVDHDDFDTIEELSFYANKFLSSETVDL